MMLSGIARDQALRSLPIFGIAAAVNTSVLLGILVWRASQQGSSISTWTLLFVAWSGVAIYLAFGQVRSRCTHFDLSLPVSTRRLWLGHLLAVLSGGSIVAALALSTVALHRRLVGAEASFETSNLLLAALLGGGVLLATLLLSAPRRSLARIPVTAGYVLWATFVLVGTPLLLTVASRAGAAGVISLFVAGLGLAGWLYRRTPAAFHLLPLEPAEAGGVDRHDSGPARSSNLLLPWTVLRGVSAGAKEWLALPFLPAFGMILGGALQAALDDGGVRELRFLYIPMATYMLFAFVGPRLAFLHHLDPLPIGRRVMCATLLVPHFLLFCAGYGAGAILDTASTSKLEWVNFTETERGYEVTVPLRTYDVVWSGSPTTVDAPWGESHTPTGLNPWRGSRAVVYSPYEAPPGATERFVALQISRAVLAAYGVSIPPETIDERYLETAEDGSVLPRGEGLTLRTDFPELRVRSGPIFPVLIALTVVPWLLLTALFLRAYRACVRERARQAIFWGALVVLLGFWLGETALVISGMMQDWAIRGLVEIPVMRAGETAVGSVAVWVVALAAVACAYAVAQRQFLRMEIPTRPSLYTLLDRIQQQG